MAGLNDGLNGIICINKPSGFTSFDVIAKLRGILGLKRLGHAGTLDPMATGVLPVFAGKATRACDMLPDRDKTYEAEFRLGMTSDTLDIFGKTEVSGSFANISASDIEKTLQIFKGNILQTPPMYSAVSVNGKRLYELARKGIEVEREKRPVTVYELELKSYNKSNGCGELHISCSKGTYIRTLISDIGTELGCGAVMSALTRTKACGFSIEDCVTIEELQELANKGISAQKYLYPIENAFLFLNEIKLNSDQEKMYHCGVRLDTSRLDFKCTEQNLYRVYSANGAFIGTACIKDNELCVDKNF